jgi:hypothetical protein
VPISRARRGKDAATIVRNFIHSLIWPGAILLSLLFLSTANSLAVELPPVVEEYRLLAQAWTLQPPSEHEKRYVLVVQRGRKSYAWPLEPGFIAQSLRGNSVPDAEVPALTEQHMAQLRATTGDVMLKLASFEEGGELFVRSVKLFNIAESFERARQFGSPILNAEAAEIRQLTLSQYSERIAKSSDSDWKRLQHRPRTKSP